MGMALVDALPVAVLEWTRATKRSGRITLSIMISRKKMGSGRLY